MKYENILCGKMIELLLLNHQKNAWKTNKKLPYNQYIPYSKQFINKWINANLFGPTQLIMSETMKYMSCPKTLQSQYKKFHPHIWTILEDPTIREIVELDSLFGYRSNEINDRLNGIIKPRVINTLAIKQYLYFFWNLEDDNGVFRPAKVLGLIESNRELSRAYSHILKYFNDKNGKIKYELFYNLFNPDEPNLKNINKVIDLIAIEQIDSLEKGNIDKIETLTDIQLKNSIVLKTLKTIPNNSGKNYFSDFVDFKDEEIEK